MFKRYIGDKTFYRRVFGVAVPIIIQNGITNFVSLLDNIMVGQVGTVPMSGVSIVNGLLFVFNLCIFGCSSGAGIFTAQYHGSGDQEGVRNTFRFKILSCIALALVGIGIFYFGGQGLIGLYLTGEGDPQEAAGAMAYGLSYLQMMLLGLIPFALCNAYSSTLRETGETMVPMLGGIAAVLVNLGLNYVLIFGHFGAPKMGVEGAALATVISRYVELAIVAGWTHANGERNPFVRGAYRSMKIPARLLKNIAIKGMPLLVNEFLWSCGMAILNQCYSTCGLSVVPAMNISSTLYNLGSVVYLSMGNAVGILMGQLLGAGEDEMTVRDENRKMTAIAVTSGLVFGGLMAACSGHQRSLFYPPLRRADHGYVPIRQLLCLGLLRAAGLCAEPVHGYGHPAPVRHLPGHGPFEVRRGQVSHPQGCVDTESGRCIVCRPGMGNDPFPVFYVETRERLTYNRCVKMY